MKQTWHLIGRSVDAHLFIVHWGFLDACLDVVFIWDFDMLDYWWLILLHCLAYWFWFWHDCSDHFTCIHSPLYITQLWLSHSRLSCVYMSDISCSAWLYDAWLPSLCMIACRLSMWVSLLSPYLPPFGFGHFLHFGSHFCKCEALCVLALWPS